MRKTLFLGLVVAAVLATTSSAMTPAVKISTRKLPKLGTVLVNSKGRTLYMFVRDKRKKVTCVGSCAAAWPPVKLPKGAKAVAAGKVKAALLGSDKDPAGGRVVTYNKWPLYTYIGDTAPGQAKGQALNLNGGLWYVLSPAGKVIKTK
jgi:predicted lipoprotein with Yx(FWY)xxD motif